MFCRYKYPLHPPPTQALHNPHHHQKKKNRKTKEKKYHSPTNVFLLSDLKGNQRAALPLQQSTEHQEISKEEHTHMTHFESKAAIDKYTRETHPNLPSSFFLPGLYLSNLVSLSFPDLPTSFVWALLMPPSRAGIPLFAVPRRWQIRQSHAPHSNQIYASGRHRVRIYEREERGKARGCAGVIGRYKQDFPEMRWRYWGIMPGSRWSRVLVCWLRSLRRGSQSMSRRRCGLS